MGQKFLKLLTKGNNWLTAFNVCDVAFISYKDNKLSVVLKNHSVIEITDCDIEDAEKVIDEWIAKQGNKDA